MTLLHVTAAEKARVAELKGKRRSWGYLRLLFLLVGCVVLDFLPFFDFGFLPFAAGCAAGVAGKGFAAAGETVSKNSALATTARAFRIRLTRILPRTAQAASDASFLRLPDGFATQSSPGIPIQ